jgi:hypothetical protein
MEIEKVMYTIAQGDYYAAGVGKVGKWLVLGSTVGLGTTQNLMYILGMVAGAGLFAIQIWWEWQRQRRRSYQDSEFHKFQLREKARSLGLDSSTLAALQVSPDPDSTIDQPDGKP